MTGEIVVHARVDYVSCPECDGELRGFVRDPRGTDSVICEGCGLEFDIPGDARVVIE